MKITKKLLCMALSVIMLVSCLSTIAFADETTNGSASKFSDVAATEIYSQAVSTLSLMNVINGYPDGTFGPEKNVTRAEFTAMLMRTLGYGSTGSTSAAELPFTDVDDNNSDINWAIPNINTAYAMGIINGYEDQTFRPSADVAYEEAVKMIVCTLGYGSNVDTSTDPWYANYIAIASQIGLTKTASKLGSATVPATRACIAQLLYDALEIKLVEKEEKTDKTILSDYLGYIKNTGVISSNDITSLTAADVNLREDEIQITAVDPNSNRKTTHTYSTTDLTLKNYLGYEVEFYYKDDASDIRTLMFCVVKDNDPVKINASDIEISSSNDTQIKYYASDNAKKESAYNLESDNVVIFNGKMRGTFTADWLPEVGSVTLIDSNANSKYDVIVIESYEIYYVSSKATATFEVIDNVTQATGKIILDTDSDRNLKIVSTSGSEMSFNSISKGNVLCVAKSMSGEELTTVIVVTDKVTGTVSAIKGDKITIAGKEYEYSNAAPWVTGANTLEEPTTQDSGTYYLDINGDIVAYDKNVSSETMYYGYIMGYTADSDSFDGDAVFRIINNSGAELRLGTYEKTKVYTEDEPKGETCKTGTEVVDMLKSTATEQNTDSKGIQQLIKYTVKTVDGHQFLNKIYTAVPSSPSKLSVDTLTMLDGINADDTADKMTYSSASKTLTAADGTSVKLLNTIVFTTPEEDERSSYSDFSKSTVSSAFKDGQSYSVELFDVDETKVASVAVVYGADSSSKIDVDSPIYVLTETGSGTLNGEVMPTVKGYKTVGSSFSNLTSGNGEFFSDESDLSDLTAGDIFRVGTDRDGLPLYDDSDSDVTELIYDYSGTNELKVTKEGGRAGSNDLYDADYAVIIGLVTAKSDTGLVITSEEDGSDKDITFDMGDFSGAKILEYREGKKLEVIESDTESLAGLSAGTSTVLIYMENGDINLVCIFPVA